MTKQQKEEVVKAYNMYWDSYIAGDITSMASFLHEDVHVFGSTPHEAFTDKQSVVAYYQATAGQISNKVEFKNRKIELQPIDKNIMVIEQSDFYLLIDDEWTFYGHARLSTLFTETKDGWKIIHQHGSFPDGKVEEGEQVAAEKIKEENLLLKEAIKRRTVELENKNRELEIEASLEKIRVQALGMRKPDHLLDICETLYSELCKMGFDELRNAMINIYEENKTYFLNYDYAPGPGKTVTKMPYNLHPLIDKQVRETKNAGDAFNNFSFTGSELTEFRELRKNNGEPDDPKLDECSSLHYYFYSIGKGSIGISTYRLITAEKLILLKQFRNVFNLAYQRYTDIVQAEAQAREAQIELGLERVRARAMAMLNSEELNELIGTVFIELTKLDLVLTRSTIIIYDSVTYDCRWWMLNSEAPSDPMNFLIRYHEHPPYLALLNAWQERSVKWQYELKGNIKKEWDDFIFTHSELSHLPQSVIDGMKAPKRVLISGSFNNFGCLSVASLEPLSDEHFDILLRFAKVFDLTYTRFNDLQKAEAQAREAQIETCLERVRSRSLAMHHTSELQEVIHTVHKELLNLNIAISGGSFIVINKDIETTLRCWGSGGTADTSEEVILPLYEKPFCINLVNGIKKGPGFFTEEFTQEEKIEFFTFLFKHEPWSKLDAKQQRKTLSSPGGYTRSCSVSMHTSIFIINHFGKIFSEDENDILKRFAKVFEQTYTRFLDLQKAEAQAREAQIELGLERVRARAMAMQHSEELAELVDTVFKELTKLHFLMNRCQIIIINPDGNSMRNWIANPEIDKTPNSYLLTLNDHPYFLSIIKAWKEKLPRWTYNLKGEEKKAMVNYVFNHTDFRNLPEIVKQGMKQTTNIYFNASFNNFGSLQVDTLEPLSEENLDILKRFGKVFDLTYTRFNDLQKAEAQAREAQIELGLERVRAKAMAMQKSNELAALVETVFKELTKLHFIFDRCIIMIYDEKTNASTWWMANPEPGYEPVGVFVEDHKHSPYQAYMQAWKNQTIKWEYLLEGKEKKDWDDFIFTETDMSLLPQPISKGMRSVESVYLNASFNHFGSLTVSSLEPLTDENFAILLRFAKVFDLTYTRFNDLLRAEAQAREAQIEVALERVRSRTMAMHNSTELIATAELLFDQINLLGAESLGVAFGICEPDNSLVKKWTNIGNFSIPYTVESGEEKMYEAWKNQTEIYEEVYEGKRITDYYETFMSFPAFREGFQKILNKGYPLPAWQKNHAAIFKYGYLLFITTKPFEETNIFIRFAKVFEQTYTRFLDLQKAEMQVREAQIEAALERIRSASMAMHSSEQLSGVIKTVTDQLQSLGFSFETANFITNFTDKGFNLWLSVPGVAHPSFIYVPYDDNAFFRFLQQGATLKKEFDTLTGSKEEKDKFFNHFFTKSDAGNIPDERKKYVFDKPGVGFTTAFRKHFYFTIVNYEGHLHSSEENTILSRFANVFEQSYTRFLDLQKAEAQARESQIQLAMERVRARTMAMQKSDELPETSMLLFKQLRELGETADQVSIGIINEEEGIFEISATVYGNQMVQTHKPRLDEPFALGKIYQSWKKKQKNIVIELTGEVFKNYNISRNSMMDTKVYNEDIRPEDRWIMCAVCFSKGVLVFSSAKEVTKERVQLLERFAGVFEQTYTRFLDLQKAESQAREAQIEAALERVRSRTLAMQKSDELSETAAEVFRQLIALGIEPNRLYIGIIKGEEGDMEMWATDEDGTQVGKKFMFNKNENASVKKLYDGWANKQKSVIVNMEGKELEDYFHYLNHVMHIPFKDGLSQKRRVQSVAYFSKGFIGMASPDGQGDETIHLLERFAAVFNLTFTRFNDLKIAEAHADQAELDLIQLKEEKKRTEEALNELQITQKQLIQSEKMASLGELTAGIAHEIQNPLNFVNNFSEVSTELIDEMNEEIQKGNLEDAKQIASDLKDNLTKINHHGKRAGDIVRGMLQHSRSSSGQKEPTDINALCDEYLRLAYHGLRAKDKSFNATLITDFDDSIGMINMIPQDIGRVVLNLITNAFYVVAEKSSFAKASADQSGYEPTITVTTKRIVPLKAGPQGVEVRVSDNGNGIPPKVLDKIFQPFFTTKPTGQGTGLGLSLSYDIVKAHGGILEVKTIENEGTEFTIQL
jgi:signal transduction histidine kinase/ketosteroid isomerase-like protein/DNA-directed RNA polymerase subunit N (RpoN/RPB10)